MKGPLLVPAGSFVLGEALYPLPNVLQEENVLPQCDPGDPLTTLCAIRPVVSFSPGVQATAPLWQKSCTSKTPEFELYTLFAIKNKTKQNKPETLRTLAPQSVVCRGFCLV